MVNATPAPGAPPPDPAHGPYGPNTARVRRFLVRLAALSTGERNAVVARYADVAGTRAFAAAERALADIIEGAGRTAARDALAGPLLQIVRATSGAMPADAPGASLPDAPDASPSDAPPDLDPIGEPALSALLALLVEDQLRDDHRGLLFTAFEEAIPLARLDG